MKKYLFALIAFSLIASASGQDKAKIEKEKKAIKAVIEEERAAFFDRDFSRVEAIWIQESTSRKFYMSQNGITKFIGWSEVGKGDKEFIEDDDRWADYENPNAEYSNFDITVYGKTALVFHDTQWSGKYLGEELNGVQTRILHLVKFEGEWKIDLMAMYRIPKEKEKPEE